MITQGKYIPFTPEQFEQAKTTDIAGFLTHQGIPLKRSGSEYCWNRSADGLGKITIRGSKWYDQYERTGNSNAIDFVIKYLDVSFPEAVQMLIGGVSVQVLVPAERERPPKPFMLPNPNSDMLRLYAYLMQVRGISRDIISYFTHEKLLYEDATYHNCVFVGRDEQGVSRHAHKRGTFKGSEYKGNVQGSRPEYSFHHLGKGNRLYVFEAPIDLLAYLSLHPVNWQDQSYVALCSVAAQGMEHILKHNAYIDTVLIGLDHDPVGIESAYRLKEIAEGLGRTAQIIQSHHKDFGEDIRAVHSETPKPAVAHPGMELIRDLCTDLTCYADDVRNLARPVLVMETRLQRLRQLSPTDSGRISERSLELAGTAFLYAKDLYRRIGNLVEDEKLEQLLFKRYRPHKDKGQLPRRMEELYQSFDIVKESANPQRAYTGAEIKQQIENVLDFSMGCLRLSAYVHPEEEQEQFMQLSL